LANQSPFPNGSQDGVNLMTLLASTKQRRTPRSCNFLKQPERFTAVGARFPKVCLVGPPGTGKTLTCKSDRWRSRSTIFSISGSEFVEMFVGVGASRVRDLFKSKENAPLNLH